jgi:hypothetical protein
MYLMGDRSEPHLVNTSMRVMMAFVTSENEMGQAKRAIQFMRTAVAGSIK